MEFDGEVIRFNIFEAMRYPSDVHSVSAIDVIDSLAQQMFDISGKDGLEIAVRECLDRDTCMSALLEWVLETDLEENLAALNSIQLKSRYELSYIELPIVNERPLPSVVQAPTLELKQLPEHLKYVYLGDNETLPVIIAADLAPVQEENLIRVLRDHMLAIGWAIADIKGISPSTCIHRILLEEGAKPTREAQRRLNPPMMEVVKNEILKLLSVGIIYPISDSKWVSPT